MTRRCLECGKGNLRPQQRAGRTDRYRTVPNLPVPADLEILTCDNCGEEWIDESTAEKIDGALAAEYRAFLREKAPALIASATQHTSQRRIETALGLSPGYLSKVRTGARAPSPVLVATLALVAQDPVRRLEELEVMWSGEGVDPARTQPVRLSTNQVYPHTRQPDRQAAEAPMDVVFLQANPLYFNKGLESSTNYYFDEDREMARTFDLGAKVIDDFLQMAEAPNVASRGAPSVTRGMRPGHLLSERLTVEISTAKASSAANTVRTPNAWKQRGAST